MRDMVEDGVLVQIVPVGAEREIGWGSNLAESLSDRLADLRAGIKAGMDAVTTSLVSQAPIDGWQLEQVSAAFGIALTAEAGVLVSKASAGATFDVTLTYHIVESEQRT